MHMTYKIVEEIADIDTYLRLRKAGDLHQFSRAAAIKGLGGTLVGILVKYNNEIVGMGRVIGDGGCFFQIVDIVVIKEHRGHGIGKQIVATLMERLRTSAPKSAYVSLIADLPANRLYEQYGFKSIAPQSIGMALSI
jgi:ribosomal protein S18 acetylase RimI-like enzyme